MIPTLDSVHGGHHLKLPGTYPDRSTRAAPFAPTAGRASAET